MIEHLKERLSSPLYFSFLSSWLLFNWEITMALFGYEVIPSTSHITILEFIQDNLSFAQSLVYPASFALGYTILTPLFKNLVSALKTWYSTWGEAWNLKIEAGSQVPFERFLRMKELNDERTKKLTDLMSTESVTQQKLDETTTALIEERSGKSKLLEELNTYKEVVGEFNNTSILQGKWIRTVKPQIGQEITDKVEIDTSNNMYVNQHMSRDHRFNIQSFVHNRLRKTISFVLWDIPGSKFHSYNEFNYDHGDLEGFEYRLEGRNAITLARPRHLALES